MSNSIEQNAGSGTIVPGVLRQPSASQNQKPLHHNVCRSGVAESLMMQILTQRLWTEDVMRLWVDSRLPDGPGGRPFPTLFGGQMAGWERTFPRCWLRENRGLIENELQRRVRDAESAGRFADKLQWWFQFIRHPSLNASRQVQSDLQGLMERALSNRELARHDWLQDAIVTFSTELGSLHVDEMRVLRERNARYIPYIFGASHFDFESYMCALKWYAKVAVDLAQGGAGRPDLRIVRERLTPEQVRYMEESRRDTVGAERARRLYGSLTAPHKAALLRNFAELRFALKGLVLAYIIEARQAFGERFSDFELNDFVNDI